MTVTDKNGKSHTKNRYIEVFDREAPTIRAGIEGELLRVEASDDLSGVDKIYVCGNSFSKLNNGTLDIRLKDYADNYEQITIQATDRAGNKSRMTQLNNPYYEEPKKDSDKTSSSPTSPSIPASTVTTPTGGGTGTTLSQSGTGGTASTGQTAKPTGGTISSSNKADTEKDPSAVSPVATEETEDNPFTPDGSATVADNASDEQGKEFYTIMTPDENVFYLIIDKQRDSENVYFLNAVTESDLMALAQKDTDSQTVTPTAPSEPEPAAPAEPEEPSEPETSEQVSRQFILSDEVDVIIDVADASALERNLYLTLQLLELGKPVVLALNMMDIVEKRGMEIDTHRLPEMLGIPVIPVSARKRTGLDVLLHAAAHHKDCKDPECLIHHHKYKPKHRHDHHSEYAMVYSDAIEDKIDLIMAELKRKYPNLTNYRWHAIKLLEQDKEISERYPVSLPDVIDRNYESDIINEKYDFIQEIIREVLVNKDRQDALTEKVDRALTHRVWGIPIFLGIMAVVFFLTFTIGDWLKGYFEMGIESLSALLSDRTFHLRKERIKCLLRVLSFWE